MSTDTPVQKDEPNASAEQQSAPVQPVSEEPVAPVTETAATTAAQGAISFTDQGGRQVTLEKPAESEPLSA